MTYLDETAAAIKSRLSDDVMPDEGGLEDLLLIYALLARVKGAHVTAEDVHDAWALWMLGQDRDHASIRPFHELEPAIRSEDLPFVEAIRAVAQERD